MDVLCWINRVFYGLLNDVCVVFVIPVCIYSMFFLWSLFAFVCAGSYLLI